jgi:carbamoyl-phosphate synthase large subunit
MGISNRFDLAFAKAKMGVGFNLPLSGNVFISVKDEDKDSVVEVSNRLRRCGFNIVATHGTAKFLNDRGIEAKKVKKLSEGRPNIIDVIKNGNINLVINTTTIGRQSIRDFYLIRRQALIQNIPCVVTISGANALARAIEALKGSVLDVVSIQSLQGS